jgi:hypothetical protein
MKKKIAFIGDSYCATYGLTDFKKYRDHSQNGTDSPTHPDLVVRHFDADIEPFGYAGRSWWYSRNKFERKWGLRFDEVEKQFEALIFFHTDHGRINNGWNDNLGLQRNVNVDHEATQATNSYYKYIYDLDFNRWAQEQWFREINRKYSHLKTVHFQCFLPTADTIQLLPGMVFKTPLIHISLGELTGTDSEIFDKISGAEIRANHFSDHNNQALAQIIIRALEHYNPGQYDIPMDDFEIINPNATCWPSPGYGTE